MSRKDEIRPASRSQVAAVGAAFLVAVAIGCAKLDKAVPMGGSGGLRGMGSGGAGVGGPGSGGSSIGREDGGYVTSEVNVNVCQEGKYKHIPQIPTVYLMVDRSGSMFDCISTTNVESACPTPADTPWNKLKDGILMVVKSLQADVRFGFSSFTGSNPRMGGMCPMLDKVAPALNNYDKIAMLYDSLPFQPNTTQGGMKFETPASQSLGLIGADLTADQAPGAKYILYVTDGEPDYCGDGNSLCPPDGVVGAIQKLKVAGITTIIFGIKSKIATDLPLGVLEAFANAGAGEPTLPPLRGATARIEDIYDQCFNTGATPDDAAGGWTRQFMTTGKPMMRGQTIGDYGATAGPTLPFKPDVADQTMLVGQLSQALAGVKSCVFDLNNLEGKMLKVDMTMLAAVTVRVMGGVVPLNDTNGWRMNTASELELVGTACSSWRSPQNNQIDIQIPCKAIVIE